MNKFNGCNQEKRLILQKEPFWNTEVLIKDAIRQNLW